jgi:hypothetical protein
MKRCEVTLPVPDNQTVRERQEQMQGLARRIESMHPDTIIEGVDLLSLTVQVVDDLVPVLRHSLGCLVTEALTPAPDAVAHS